jgi:glycosyltransferase involved in cell wall biosynthesis
MGRAMVTRGHRVTVVGLYAVPGEVEENDRGVRVVRVPHGQVRGANLLLHRIRIQNALKRIHRDTPIDLLEGPENGFALSPRTSVAPRLIRMHGGHRFFTVTTGKQPRLWRSWLERRSFQRAEHICAVSHFVAKTTRGLLPLGDRRIEVIPNPVDVFQFRVRRDVPEQDGLILFVGAVREKKGVLQLVHAMPEIVRAAPRAQLWIVGQDVIEPQYGGSFTAHLRSLMPEAIKSHVVFKGAVDHTHLADLIARASVCVYPSHSEAMPIAWLEGMAAGKAVVVSYAGPGPELVDDGVCGLFCDPLDPGSIARAVIRALQNPLLRQALGREARNRAVTRFSVDALVERNEAFYQRCIEEHVER